MKLRRAAVRLALIFGSVLTMQTALSQAVAEAPCLIVYGHARNSGAAAENAAWDSLNARFNEQVTRHLQANGQRAESLLFKAGVTDVPEAIAALVERAQQRGCPRVVDTAVFADAEAQTLVVRLRVHPLLGIAGPRAEPSAAVRIGEPVYAAQQDLAFSARSLERVDLTALAAQMVDGYLARP